jgi:hypothetical protein
VTSTWSVTSGPGNITFGDPSAAATTATFSTLGTYVLRLTASDTALSAFAEVQITVAPPPTNLAPVVSAGADQMISLPVTSVSLAGTVSDDGLPTGAAVTATWSPQSGPGTVLFANAAAAATTATFSTTGTYVLRLTASDTALSAFAECQVTLLPPGALHLLLHLTFDEGSGTTAADSSGFGRNGTLGGGATWVAGKMGTAVQFNEYSSNVIVPDFPLTSEFSVSFWFQENNHSATCEKEYLFSWGGPYTPNNVNVWLSNWTPTSCLLADAEDANDTWLGADALTLADTTLFNGQWHHYCLTTSAAYGVKEYVDGVLRTTSPTIGGGAIDPGTNLFIGCRSDLNASRFYGGAIDDVRIYDSALAPSDVLALYSGTPANTAPTASAGPDCKVMIPNALTLAGTISDDGQPAPPAACTAAWSVVLGPGAVTFGSPSAAITTATFSTAGTYVLMLTANDSALTGASTVTVTALAPGDFNGDGKVDGVDFLIWQSHYPRSSGGTPDGGDANGDGKVDGVDFLVWQTNYHS